MRAPPTAAAATPGFRLPSIWCAASSSPCCSAGVLASLSVAHIKYGAPAVCVRAPAVCVRAPAVCVRAPAAAARIGVF